MRAVLSHALLLHCATGWVLPTHRRPQTLRASAAEDPAPSPLTAPKRDERAEWVTPTDWLASPDDVSEHEQLVPLYVLDGPLVPGSQHEVNVPAEDAGLVRMFDDLLATGGRRVVTTWGVRDRNGTCLARYGCGMTLEKITDARSESGGRLQWRCAHALGRDRVRIHKVVARGAGDASYLRCVASDAPDAEVAPAVRAGAAVRVRAGKHAGVAGTVEAVVNGWVRLRTNDGGVVASRGRRSVEVLDDGAEAVSDKQIVKEEPKEEGGSPLAGLLKKLEEATGDLAEVARRLDQRRSGPPTLDLAPATEKFASLPAPPIPKRERALLARLAEVASLQRECDEDVRFNERAVDLLGASRGVGVGTLWNVAEAWLAYLDQRAAAARRKLHADVHERLLDFLRASGRLGDAGDDASATLALSELPDELRSALATLDARVADDLEPIGGAKHELQALLDAETHDARCDAFCGIVRRERGRLAARKSLRKLFGEPGVFADTVPLPEGWRFDDDDDDDDVSSSGYQFS